MILKLFSDQSEWRALPTCVGTVAEPQEAKKYEMYAAAFSGHIFLDMLLEEQWTWHSPLLDPLLTGEQISFWARECKIKRIFFILKWTRMHSSRMRTARSSSRLLWGCLPQCMLGYPPECGPGDPLGVGLRPPRPGPSTSPLGVGLEICKACWDTTCNACWDTIPPWTEFLIHATENITLPQTSFAGGNHSYLIQSINLSCFLMLSMWKFYAEHVRS